MDDEYTGPYDPAAIRNLVIAIMEQAVDDILLGDPSAINWMKNSAGFDHYCAWLDINPKAAREALEAHLRQAKQAKYNEADLRRVKQLHDNGMSVHQGIIKVFGTYTENRRQVVNGYLRSVTQPAMEAA